MGTATTTSSTEAHKITRAMTAAWTPQIGAQVDAITATWCDILFFGGARGGGKSDYLLGDYLQDVPTYGPHWQGILFRRTYPELQELVSRSKRIYPPTGAIWREQDKEWHWPNGAILRMRYLERDDDAARYQGHQYTWIGWDELTQWASPTAFNLILACLRWAEEDVPTKRIRCSGNPGGAGHQWVKEFFIDTSALGYKPVESPETKMTRMYIPSKVYDNHILLDRDPGYVDRLRGVGSTELVRAWLEGDWNAVTGAYFDTFCLDHILEPFAIPEHWTRFRAIDWGSAKPFSIGWYAVADGESDLPRGSLVKYREWYGRKGINEGLKMQAMEVARGILSREAEGEKISYTVVDPSMFKVDGGISHAETFRRNGVVTQPADNSRLAGWEQVRSRLIGDEGKPLLYFFSTCKDTIRTLPALQHDQKKPEDLDSDAEDHCLVGNTEVITSLGKQKIEDMPRNGIIASINGWQAYVDCGVRHDDIDVVRVVFSDQTEVVCTLKHRLLTTKGWVEAIDLTDELCYDIKVCKSLLYQRQSRNLITEDTTSVGDTSVGNRKHLKVAKDYIKKFGNITIKKFQKGSTSIIQTITLQTIRLKILNYYQDFRTYLAMQTLQEEKNNHGNQLKSLKRPRQFGMAAEQVSSGINLNIRKLNIYFIRKLRKFVCCVAKRLKPALLLNTATQIVELKRCVSVERLKEKQKVYCLKVPITKSFILASGLVSHNCADETRYACMSRPLVKKLDKVMPMRTIHNVTLDELWEAQPKFTQRY